MIYWAWLPMGLIFGVVAGCYLESWTRRDAKRRAKR